MKTTYGKRITITDSRWRNDGNRKTEEVHYQYRDKITGLLDLIGTVRTGHVLLMDIDTYAGGGKVTVMPTLARQQRACFSEVQPYKKGNRLLQQAEVEFSPSSFGSACSGVGTSPEEVLFHELVHAAQILHGVLDLAPLNKAPKMSNFTEFCAVTASNIFRSNLGRSGLRAGHRGRDEADTLTDPNEYYTFFRDEIDRWFRIQPIFCRHLAQMEDIPFNPLRAKVQSDRAHAP